MTEPGPVMAALEDSRRQFVDAIDAVPADALRFLRPGDDYSMGGLVTHVNGVLRRYGAVLTAILADGGAEFNAAEVDAAMEVENERSRLGIEPADRAAAMATLAALHDHVVNALTSIDVETLDRKTPVRYGGGDPYPTSAANISGWLTDHYLEHVPHVSELLDAWQRDSGAG